MKRLSLRAVHEHDLEKLLESLGLLDVVTWGHAICVHCGDVVTLETLHCLIPRGEEILLACSKPICVEAVHLERPQ